MNIEEQKQRHAWLESLKPGDQVATPDGGIHEPAHYAILTVDRVTSTQIVLKPEADHREARRFKISTGDEIGLVRVRFSTRCDTALQPVTAEVTDANEACDLRHWLYGLTARSQDMRLLTIAELRGIKRGYDGAKAAL